MRIAQILRDLVDRHHGGALFRERSFLPRLGLELCEFVHRMAQPVCLAPRLLHARAMSGNGLLRAAPLGPEARDRGSIILTASVSVEQPPMRRDIDQRALVVLAMDL